MNKKSAAFLLGFAFLFLYLSSSVYAKNSQTLVIGFGFGAYNFDDEDVQEIKNIIYGSEFIEWYLFDEIGLGIRTHKFYKSGSTDSDEELLMGNMNLTINWVLFGAEDDFRMVAYVGYGPGAVSYKNEETNQDISETTNTSSGGLFVDWGGEFLGIRLGVHMVSASYEYEDEPDSGTINGSGSSVDLGVRLAF